jgi:plastocyanin
MIGFLLRLLRPAVLALVLSWMSAGASAATVHHVAQKNRAFSVNEITIARGDVVEFSNNDEFLHQIYISDMGIDSAEQHPGETITVTFSQTGTFAVRCHIHPKMLLVVHVN